MKIVEQTEAKAPLADYAEGVAQEPVIVTVNGKPIAALVAIENADLETVSLSTNAAFLALIERSRVRHRAEGGLSGDEAKWSFALGHQIGRSCHDGAALLGPRWEKYGDTTSRPLEPGNVFTLELEVQIPPQAIPETPYVEVKVYPGVLAQVVEGLEKILQLPYG